MQFDAIVIGSGMGGSACAYALTEKGKKVALIEAGGNIHHDDKDWDGKSILVDGRYKSKRPVWIKQYGQTKAKAQPQEEVLGGKTMFYGGACFRLRERDFASWPLGYEDFAPWYDLAEKMLEVHGQRGQDKTEPPAYTPYPYPPAPLSAPAQRVFNAAKDLGLHPCRIPMAINDFNKSRPVCIHCNTCDGFPCKIKAKNEAVSCFLSRAKQELLHVVLHAVATQIHHDGTKATHVTIIDQTTKTQKTLYADKIIVSAGAIESAALLLRSQVPDASGLIGKYLMRHINSIVGFVFPFATNPSNVFHKQMVITDHYYEAKGNHATGVIQDIYMPPKEVLPYFVPTGIGWISQMLRNHIQNLLCITEDEALATNAVNLLSEKDHLGLPKVSVQHQYTQNDVKRNQILIRSARKILSRAGGILSMVRKIDTFSHAVGTARFGEDPKQSVLDTQCKLHQLDNVYVVDGSFMPSSGGVNPSLTIAANALRVSNNIASEQST